MRRCQDKGKDKGQYQNDRKDDAGKHEVAAAVRRDKLHYRGQARGCKGICLQVYDTGDQAATIGFFRRRVTPYMAGSVTPASSAEIPAGIAI